MEVELRGVVTVRVKREGLGKDSLVAVTLVALEAQFTGVERVGETDRQPKPFDTKFESVQ